MEKFYLKRFESFKDCLADFSKARGRDYINDTLVLGGVVSKFTLTFDLSWKVLKDLLVEYYGANDFPLGSPRSNFEAAFSTGLIEDNHVWFEMLKLRNQLAHDYNSKLALASCKTIIDTYLPFFESFAHDIEIKFTEINKI